jgi:hypothetical protein
MDPGGKIYTIDEFRCWKVENPFVVNWGVNGTFESVFL